ncbi:hypothetical protein GCM10008905_25490 [Clostridium malenominatum]|uniref:Transcriptional regulator n=1 Tax=Clostridium malenominatum TaxID=1539 RepID=A0ABN1J3I0_9CLOT
MNNKKSFGEHLGELLKIFNLKGSTLSKGINVDSSLVYKWLRNERVPSYHSPYIELITNYLVNNIKSSFQKMIVIEALKKWSLDELDMVYINMEEMISKNLIEAQGYSIELLSNRSKDEKQIKKNTKISPNIENDDIPKLHIKENLFSGTDSVNIVKGHKEILFTALHILENLPDNPSPMNDTIFITFNSAMELILNYKDFNTKWQRALYNVLNNGWKVIYLVKLIDNAKRTLKLIHDMQFALATGRYLIYYYENNSNISALSELIIVPKICALHCFSSQLKTQVDSAFFFNSPMSIEILLNHFSMVFSSAKPLLQPCSSQKSLEFQCMLAELEESLGDRYVFKDNINLSTFPIDLYEKYLKLNEQCENKIFKLLSLHRRRLNAFHSQIKYYNFKEIWVKESIEKLVSEHKYSFSQWDFLGDNIMDINDIIYHLETVIDMLKKYENYQIAIISKSHYENISKICWMVKENSNVFIERLNCNIENPNAFYDFNLETTLLVSEKEVVTTFQNYFLLIWNNINYINKDKAEIIKWLQNQIALLKDKDKDYK